MTDITIIGTGNMGRALGTRAAAAGKSVQIIDREPDRARELSGQLGASVTAGAEGDAPAGDIVVLAVPFDAAKEIVTSYGQILAGKTVVDISNPVDASTFDSLTVPPGTSAAETIAGLAADGASVVKAFNTTFAATLAVGEVAGQPLDVFIAGDSEPAKTAVADFASAAHLHPVDVGPLRRARELEAFQLLVMALQANPALREYNWDTALKLLTRD